MTANLSNWRDPEHVVWSFQNVDKILNTTPIKKGDKTTPLRARHVPVNLDYFNIKTSDGKSFDLSTFQQETNTDGIIVLKDGKIVYEHYDRTNTEKSIHIMMSMTKSVAGLIAGILVDQGRLDVDAVASTYVPELRGTSYENVKLQQLLDMRAGIKFDDADPEYRRAAGWHEAKPDEEESNLHSFISKFNAPPGPKVDGLMGGDPFEYVSVNTDLMGWILERASGKKFADLVGELLWQPMGAESDAYISTDRAGNVRPAGGMCATVRDLARVCQLMLHDEECIVPSKWIHDMMNNGSKEAFAAGPWSSRGSGEIFGNAAYRSYWVADDSVQLLMGLGVHGQMMFADRQNKIVMVKTSSQPDRFDGRKAALTAKAFREFRRILTSTDA